MQVAGQLGIGAAGHFRDKASQSLATFQQIDDVLALPAALPDQDQARGAIAQPLNQVAPCVQEQKMIFARLDGAQNDKIGLGDQPSETVCSALPGPSNAAVQGGSGRLHSAAKADNASRVAWELVTTARPISSTRLIRARCFSRSPGRQYSG